MEIIDYIIIFHLCLGPNLFFPSIIVFAGSFYWVVGLGFFVNFFFKSSYLVKISFLKYFSQDFSHRRNFTNSQLELQVPMLLPAMVSDSGKFYSLFASGRSNDTGWQKQVKFTCSCIVLHISVQV